MGRPAWRGASGFPREETDAIRLPAITAVLFLLACSQASAHGFAHAQLVADEAWRYPCAGQVKVRTEPLDRGTLGWAYIRSPESVGGYDDRCVVGLRDGWWRWRWATLCTVVVHEHGHLAGYGHSDDPRSVMFPWIRVTFPGCLPPRKRTAAARGRLRGGEPGRAALRAHATYPQRLRARQIRAARMERRSRRARRWERVRHWRGVRVETKRERVRYWRSTYWQRQWRSLTAAERAWALRTARCESGNRPVVTGNGFRSRFQWVLSTWYAAGGRGLPERASFHEEAVRAVRWRNRTSWRQWPVCGRP